MTQSHERTPIDLGVQTEQPKEAVGRFVEFTRHPFEAGEFMGDTLWTAVVDGLYGDEELARITGDASYRGIEGIGDELETALIEGGLDLLKATFFVRLHEHTGIANTRSYPKIEAIRRIISFK